MTAGWRTLQGRSYLRHPNFGAHQPPDWLNGRNAVEGLACAQALHHTEKTVSGVCAGTMCANSTEVVVAQLSYLKGLS